jgi:hypothetical protein
MNPANQNPSAILEIFQNDCETTQQNCEKILNDTDVHKKWSMHKMWSTEIRGK